MKDITQVEESETDDYSFEQLKAAVLRRQESLQRIKDIYANDPRMNRTGIDAGLEAFSGQDFGGNSHGSYQPFIDGKNKQLDFLRQSKLEPEMLQQKFDETDPFTNMLKKVMAAKAMSYKPEVKVVGSSLVKYDSTTDTTQVLFSDVKNSPLYGKIWDQIYTSSLKDEMQFKDDVTRRAYVKQETDKAFADAVSRDSTKVGAQTEPVNGTVELPRGPLTDANQTGRPTEIGSTPATARSADPELEDAKRALVAGKMTRREYDYFVNSRPSSAVPDKAGPNVFGKPKGFIPPKLAASAGVGSSPAIARNPLNEPDLRTVRDRKVDEKMAEGEVADYQTTKDQIGAMFSANQSMIPMEGILLSGKHTSGQMHETLTKVGGYLTYLDPEGNLAKSVGNDAAYFGIMMNLVRDKIQALGSGTAVSNLDLIVTQKSVGDLRNTPQGNLKIIGLSKLYNATMSQLGQAKIEYFDKNGKLQGYKSDNEPTHAIRATRNPYKDSTIISYNVQTKGDWVKEQIRRNPGKEIPPDILDREWKRFADNSVRAMFK